MAIETPPAARMAVAKGYALTMVTLPSKAALIGVRVRVRVRVRVTE